MPVDKLPPHMTDGLVGILGGAVAGALAMLYQKYKTDERIEKNRNSIYEIEKNYMSRAEIIQLHRENKAEMKSIHKDQNNKLDMIIEKLSQINVTLAGKADKK